MSKIFILIIRFYRKYLSPLKPACCRFYPTCSEYALTAFRRFGFFKGFALSFGRICRCNPFCKGGYDPVPEKELRVYPANNKFILSKKNR